LREMARRVKRDEVHEGMHCDGCTPQALYDGGGAVAEGCAGALGKPESGQP